jgi:hypothetical protein
MKSSKEPNFTTNQTNKDKEQRPPVKEPTPERFHLTMKSNTTQKAFGSEIDWNTPHEKAYVNFNSIVQAMSPATLPPKAGRRRTKADREAT